jgi:hypothetical protein
VNRQRYGEVSAVLDRNDERTRRVLLAILDVDIPFPALSPDGVLPPALVDSVQAAMLRRELARRLGRA